jgi:hypothetical protein
MGYSLYDQTNCEDIQNCYGKIGCNKYSTESPPETNFNLGKESNYLQFRGINRQGYATGSWPGRGQQSCNYFDKSNPIINDYIRKMDIQALPPN